MKVAATLPQVSLTLKGDPNTAIKVAPSVSTANIEGALKAKNSGKLPDNAAELVKAYKRSFGKLLAQVDCKDGNCKIAA